MTWRKLGVLVSQLPPESATSTALRVDIDPDDLSDVSDYDPEGEQWSRAEHLIASVRDELHALRHHYLQSHSNSPIQWQPDPLPRPGIARRTGVSKVSTEQTSLLAAHLALVQGDTDN